MVDGSIISMWVQAQVFCLYRRNLHTHLWSFKDYNKPLLKNEKLWTCLKDLDFNCCEWINSHPSLKDPNEPIPAFISQRRQMKEHKTAATQKVLALLLRAMDANYRNQPLGRRAPDNKVKAATRKEASLVLLPWRSADQNVEGQAEWK